MSEPESEDGTVAPDDSPRPEWLHHHTGPNRAERRAARAVMPDGSTIKVPKEYREQATNKPYVKDESN